MDFYARNQDVTVANWNHQRNIPHETERETASTRSIPPSHLTESDSSTIQPTVQERIFRHRVRCGEIVVILFMLLISLATFKFIMPPPQYFNPLDPEINYPETDVLVSSALVSSLGFTIPIMTVIVLTFWATRHDLKQFWGRLWTPLLGIFYAHAVSLYIVGLLWVTTGELRPRFMTRCQLPQDLINQAYAVRETQVTQFMVSTEQCSQVLEPNDLHGFPSGHSATAFTGATVMALYLREFAYFKGWTTRSLWAQRPYLTPFAAFFVYMIPLAMAICLSFLRLQDHSHSFRQLIVGILIGIGAGIFSWIRHRGYFSGWAHEPRLDEPVVS